MTDFSTPLVNLEAEEATIGSLLLSPELLPVVRPILGPDGAPFYTERFRWLYRALVSLAQEGAYVDPVTILDRLGVMGRTEDAGGAATIAGLLNATPSSAHAAHYARIVARYAVARDTIAACSTIAQAAAEVQEPALLQARVNDILAGVFRGQGKTLALRDLGLEMLDTLQAKQKRLLAEDADANANVLISGIKPLDALLGPLAGGDLRFILAPTSTGKTSLELQGVRANAKRGRRPAFYYNELSATRLMNRLTIMESVDWANFVMGRARRPIPLITEEMLRVGVVESNPAYVHTLKNLALWLGQVTFIPAHGWTARQIVDDFTALWEQGLCDQVWVDYLDLIQDEYRSNGGGGMSEAIGDRLATLKNGAASCRLPHTDGIPIVVSGQPPKSSSGDIGRPSMNDTYGSVRPSQYASQFLTMWRERDTNGQYTGVTLIRVEKNPEVGHEGHEVACAVAGDENRRGFTFYPIAK
jgi:hypothetical protein